MVSHTIHTAVADAGSVSQTVVDLVREATGAESPMSTPPLYDTVDPEALDELFAPSADSASHVGFVTFWYQGCRVLVSDGGRVTVESEPARRYRLRCVDCEYETLVEGTSAEAFGLATEHQSTYGSRAESHLVEFTRDASDPAVGGAERATD